MTTETMREAVKRAIYAKLEVSVFLPYEEIAEAEPASRISEEDVSHEFLDSIAADVIRTVLERLRDSRLSVRIEFERADDRRGPAPALDNIWQAMLDAAAREVG